MINEQLKELAEIIKGKYSELLAAGLKVNDLILMEYQQATGANTFQTFKQWKDQGMKVKKGEKGFPIFSKPIQKKAKEEEGEQDEKKGPKYFHTAYLFHEGQVEPMTEKEKPRDPQMEQNIERIKQLTTI